MKDNEVMIRLYDTFGSGAYVAFARIKKYKRKDGFRVDVLWKYVNTGSWRSVASAQVSTIEEAVDFIADHSLANKDALEKELEELKKEVWWLA